MTQRTLSTPEQHLSNDVHWFANVYQAQSMGVQNMNSVVGCSCHTSLQTITIILPLPSQGAHDVSEIASAGQSHCYRSSPYKRVISTQTPGISIISAEGGRRIGRCIRATPGCFWKRNDCSTTHISWTEREASQLRPSSMRSRRVNCTGLRKQYHVLRIEYWP